jgi:hypothetical protein
VAPLGGNMSVGVGNFTIGVCSTDRGDNTTPAAVDVNGVSPGYFHTLETPLVEGRDFTLTDSGAVTPPNMPPAIVRTVGAPGSMIPTVRRAMTELNANTPTFSEAPVTDLVERRLRRERLLAALLSIFAAITVFICCLGIYGMLSYAVERRRQEISVRMAIGARTADVVRLMVRNR